LKKEQERMTIWEGDFQCKKEGEERKKKTKEESEKEWGMKGFGKIPI